MTDSAGRRTRPYAPRMAPEERREQLLDAALRVIVNQGVHKVSMDAVAKEAGVTRPVLYGQFADSNALLSASLTREEGAAMAQIVAILPGPEQSTPAQALINTLEGFLAAVRDEPDRWRAIFTLVDSSTPEFRARLESGRAVVLGALEDVIRRAISDRGLEPDTDVEMLARTIYSVLWEAGRLVLSESDTFPPDRIIRFARNAVGSYLGPTAS